MILINNIPLPPSVNESYSSLRDGRRVKSKELYAYKNRMAMFKITNHSEVFQAKLFAEEICKHKNLGLRVDSYFFFHKDRVILKGTGFSKKLDVHNYVKALHDSLVDLIEIDDCFIWAGDTEKIICDKESEQCVIIKLSQHPIRNKTTIRVAGL